MISSVPIYAVLAENLGNQHEHLDDFHPPSLFVMSTEITYQPLPIIVHLLYVSMYI